jgi:hypothetical protein
MLPDRPSRLLLSLVSRPCLLPLALQVLAVRWDATIASQAARFAAGCPRGHSNTNGVGENMACECHAVRRAQALATARVGTHLQLRSKVLSCGAAAGVAGGYASFEAAIDAWYNEVKQYNFGRPGYSSGTGHFTQVSGHLTRGGGGGRRPARRGPRRPPSGGPMWAGGSIAVSRTSHRSAADSQFPA